MTHIFQIQSCKTACAGHSTVFQKKDPLLSWIPNEKVPIASPKSMETLLSSSLLRLQFHNAAYFVKVAAS